MRTTTPQEYNAHLFWAAVEICSKGKAVAICNATYGTLRGWHARTQKESCCVRGQNESNPTVSSFYQQVQPVHKRAHAL